LRRPLALSRTLGRGKRLTVGTDDYCLAGCRIPHEASYDRPSKSTTRSPLPIPYAGDRKRSWRRPRIEDRAPTASRMLAAVPRDSLTKARSTCSTPTDACARSSASAVATSMTLGARAPRRFLPLTIAWPLHHGATARRYVSMTRRRARQCSPVEREPRRSPRVGPRRRSSLLLLSVLPKPSRRGIWS
jgi:hypothetical protein